jgi:hypothetical protein
MIKARRSYFQIAPIVKLILDLKIVLPSYFKSMAFAISFFPSSTSYQNTTALYSSYMQLLYGSINAWDWWELNGAYQDGPSNGPASAR